MLKNKIYLSTYLSIYPQKDLNITSVDQSFIVWATLKYFIGGNFAGERFSTRKKMKFRKSFQYFSPSVFFPINILLFSTLIKMYMVKQ